MKYTITIPKPCSEKWNEMTPTEKGMFCDQCKKEVIDFTNHSNYGLRKLLDSNKKLCGRFRPNQLNTEFSSTNNKNFITGGLAVGMVSLLSLCAPVQAQSSKPSIEISEQLIGVTGMVATEKISDSLTVTGNIKDSSGPLPGANVTIKGTNINTQADFDGNFSITIPTDEFNSKITLITSYIGYITNETAVSEKYQNITLTMSEDVMGELVITRKWNIFRRIGNIFRKKH